MGTAEVLPDDSLRLTEKAKESGVDVTLEVRDDMPHVWQVFAFFLPEARQALENCGEFAKKHTS